jgi:C4-type Zn-finger protein
MAYESKALLASIAEILIKSDTVKEAYKSVAKIANVEGVIMQPYDEAKKELETD